MISLIRTNFCQWLSDNSMAAAVDGFSATPPTLAGFGLVMPSHNLNPLRIAAISTPVG